MTAELGRSVYSGCENTHTKNAAFSTAKMRDAETTRSIIKTQTGGLRLRDEFFCRCRYSIVPKHTGIAAKWIDIRTRNGNEVLVILSSCSTTIKRAGRHRVWMHTYWASLSHRPGFLLLNSGSAKIPHSGHVQEPSGWTSPERS